MATFTFASGFSQDGIGVDGLTVGAYKASRFTSAPALNASPPGGGADAATTTGPGTGFSGSFAIALPTSEAYYVTVSNGGTAYWLGPVYGVFEDGTAEGGAAAAGTMDPFGGVVGFAPLASPALTGTPTINGADVPTSASALAITGTPSSGKVLTATSGTAADWATPAAGGVSSFNTRTGAVAPVSGDYTVGEVTGAAPLASPALTGTPTAPTAFPGTNTTQLATTAFVASAAASGVSSFNTRNGAVVPATGDYSMHQVQLVNTGVQNSTFASSAGDWFYPLDSTSGAFTATLPSAPPDGTTIGFKIVASATPTNVVTVAAAGSDVLNVAGTTTATIKVSGEAQIWVYRAATGIWYAESSTPVGQLDLRYAPITTQAVAAAAALQAAAANAALSLFTSTQCS